MAESAFLSEVETVHGRLGEPDLSIVDCRFSLLQPEQGHEEYLQGHIPGAVYADLDLDLAGPVTAESGRHPLPDIAAFASKLGQWGIGKHTEVVVYDQANGAVAARMWWMLRWMGHQKVSLLNGGFLAWVNAGNDLQMGDSKPVARNFNPCPQPRMIIRTEEVLAKLLAGRMPLLVDAREAARFAGEAEPVDSVAGHIPGAVSFPLSENLRSDGRWLPRSMLAQRWDEHLGKEADFPWITMCGSGVTACHLAFSAQYAGFAEPQLYVGSWSEWIRDPARPIAGNNGIARADPSGNP